MIWGIQTEWSDNSGWYTKNPDGYGLLRLLQVLIFHRFSHCFLVSEDPMISIFVPAMFLFLEPMVQIGSADGSPSFL